MGERILPCPSCGGHLAHAGWCPNHPSYRPAPTPEVEAGERETCAHLWTRRQEATGGKEMSYHWLCWACGATTKQDPNSHRPAPSQSPQGSELGDDRLISCPECGSCFDAEDHTVHADLVSPEQAREREAAAWDRCVRAQENAGWLNAEAADAVRAANPFRANRGDAA